MIGASRNPAPASPEWQVIGLSTWQGDRRLFFYQWDDINHAGDYDHWQEQGASGWSYADILPYFRKMETALDGEPGWRGENGPLHISRGIPENPLHAAGRYR